jgi:ApaG protein
MPNAPSISEPAPRATKSYGSTAETHGVRVQVQPTFVPDQSDPDGRQFLFSYRIRITNTSEAPVKLLSRAWVIVNGNGERDEVRGPGVVGQQPRILPGASFEYSSFCPMRTHWGTMEGSYEFLREDGSKFHAKIGRFYLVADRESRK